MNREQRVLAAVLSSRGAYNAIAALRDENDFSEQGWLLMQEVDVFYDTDADAECVDRDLIKDTISRKYDKASKIINVVIDDLEAVSVGNVTKDYVDLKKQALEHTLADTMLAGGEYSDLMERLLSVDSIEEESEDTLYVGADIDDILSATSSENLIRIHPLSLNEKIDGGLIGGQQVCIYAPTEVGKSMFTINATRGFLQDGRTVLYFGNEDPAKSMLLRMYTSLTGLTKEEIRQDPDYARRLAYDAGWNNLIFKELCPGSLREVRALVEKYKPDVVVMDQMANMECRSSSKVEKNEILACGLRAMAKKYEFVSIIVHQASDDAYGKNVLEKNHLYYSNVGVQGQMDLMIGLGMDSSYDQQSLRMVCLTKNKLSGNHENFPVRVNEALSRVED